LRRGACCAGCGRRTTAAADLGADTFAFERGAELVDDVPTFQRRHAHALDVQPVIERDRARAFTIRADGHRDVLVQDGELARDGPGVGRAQDDVDRERLVLALPRGRHEPVEEHFVLDVVLQRHDVDLHVLRRRRADGGVEVAGRLVAVPDEDHAVHRVAAERRQRQLDGRRRVRPVADTADRAALQFELGRLGHLVDQRAAVEADHAHAVLERLAALRIGELAEFLVERFLERLPGELTDLRGGLADVAEDDDFQVLVRPLEPHAADDQDEQQQHGQTNADRHPLAHRTESVERALAEEHDRRRQRQKQQPRLPVGQVFQQQRELEGGERGWERREIHDVRL
jgi:hypothetical protein